MNDASQKRYGLVPVALILLTWAAIAWFSHYRYQPPPVVPASAPPNVFSAERAEAFFERLYKNTTPHPAGSNAEFRDRIVEEFCALGYEVALQQGSSMEPNWRYEGELPVPLTNIIASKPPILPTGRPNADIILAGHFDSHPDSPGAADDGVAVCILLEIARMLRDADDMQACQFLLTDGEEFGLLGAREFVRGADRGRFKIINVEARGTTGPSLMFETSDDSRWLVDVFAKSARRPFASSLFFEIYKFLPNDTDFTVFRDAGMRGMNFAFIGDVKNYHTPDDNFDNLDRRSLQHQGENVWNVLQNMSVDELEYATGSSVYFDCFGYFVVRWPAPLTHWLLGSAILLGLVGLTPGFGRKVPGTVADVNSNRHILFAGSLLLVSLIVCSALGWLINVGLALDGAYDYPFPDNPVAIELTFWLWPLCAIVGLALLAGEKTSCFHVSVALFGFWTALAALATWQVVGASYLFVVPLVLTAALAVLARVATGWKDPRLTTVLVSVCAAVAVGLIWLPMERIFYDAVGFKMNLVIAARVATVLSMLLPVLVATRRESLMKLLVVAVGASIATTLAAVVFN